MKTKYSYALIPFLFSSSIFAADLSAAKSIDKTDKNSIWQGLYFGINGGIGGSESSLNQITGSYRPGYSSYVQPITSIGMLKLFNSGGSGPVIGGQIGYNYIISTRYLLGIETDFSYSDIGDVGSSSSRQMSSAFNQLNANLENNNYKNSLNWYGTLRGRIGYNIGKFLPFLTGGLAYGKITGTGLNNLVSTYASNNISLYLDKSDITKTSVGWTAGGGFEYLLANNLSLRSEFLFLQLPKVGVNKNVFILYNKDSGSTGDGVNRSVGNTSVLNNYITRIGINYFPQSTNSSIYESPHENTTNNNFNNFSRDFYIGTNASYASGNIEQNGANTGAIGASGAGYSSGSFNANDTTGGALAGIQAGYNFRLLDTYILGIETDYQWSGLQNSDSGNYMSWNVGNADPAYHNISNYRNRLEWFGSSRIRLGYDFGKLMPYITTGVGYGMSTLTQSNQAGSIPFFKHTFNPQAFLQPGWVLGTGLEFNTLNNWTTKFEYLYTSLGSYSQDRVSYGQGLGIPSVGIQKIIYSQDFHQVRVGLNYHFNAGEEKVVGKY